jgi:glycine hydroxymethyltransferase
VIAAKAVAFLEALQPDFALYSARVIANARALGEGLASHGFHLVSGGTDNHLLLLDLRPSHPELTGKDAEGALEAAGITMNKNTVPGETRSPFVTSGLRIGTPALTTRGMAESQMAQVAGWIAEVLAAPADEGRIAGVRARVFELCEAFPLYAELASAR